MRHSINSTGRVGVIAPTELATGAFRQQFFNHLVEARAIVSLYDFENRRTLFPIDSRYRFCLLTLTGKGQPSNQSRFVSYAHDVADIDDPDKNYTLTRSDLVLFNPNTGTLPTFYNHRDAAITKGIYRTIPVLISERGQGYNPWDLQLRLMFMQTKSDTPFFRTRSELEDRGWVPSGNYYTREDGLYLPLYVSAMIHQYDHRWKTFENGDFRKVSGQEKQDPTFIAQPRQWVPAHETNKRIGDDRGWLLGWRDITNATNERTLIMSPHPRAATADTLPQVFPPPDQLKSTSRVTAVMNSFPCDFVARQKVAGTHVRFFMIKQFSVLAPSALASHRAFIEERVLELCYTAWDMVPFGADLGYNGPPFRWDDERRAIIRSEIDALMFRLYGLGPSDIDYILNHTFEGVGKGDAKRWGEYRTSRLILERYDAMEQATRDGNPYRTILDPPPAHASVAHDWSTRPDWHPLPTRTHRLG